MAPKHHISKPPYKDWKAPVITLNDLPGISDQKIVGIDLTGSETKASGWALLQHGTAQTKRVLSNQDVIEATIKEQPSVISIDAPLSLPAGRITVFDDDPGRKLYGITRECERIMTKRGFRSYPPLIRSMQKLTQRGIYLAGEFRKLGYEVIEGYPGITQDLLGIPRKRKSKEYLLKGLQAFGIKGTYDQKGTTHDEWDAITAALVGYFFLAGKYERLGNEVEGYLVIPKII